MSKIVKQDTNGVKPLLAVGELGYDNYPSGGDIGRVYVGTGSSNIAQAKKSEVVTVDGKVDTHVARIDNPHGVTKTQVGLSNVDNTSDVNKPVSTAIQTALNLKANLASPALTGTPTAPTASVGTSNTVIATTAFVNAEIANDTYSKAQLDVGQLDNRYYTETEIDTLDNTTVKLTGDQTIAGIKTFTSSLIVPTPTTDFQVATKKYVDEAIAIDNTDDLATYAGSSLVIIVKDINRGGIFVSKTEVDIDPNTGSVYTVNSGTVFAKSGGGFWVRQFSGAVNVKWFGAKGDGTGNDAPFFQIAIQYLNNMAGGTLIIPQDTYKFTTSVTIVSLDNITIEGVGSPIIDFQVGAPFKFGDFTSDVDGYFTQTSPTVTNLKISGIQFIPVSGNGFDGSIYAYANCICLSAVESVEITNCYFEDQHVGAIDISAKSRNVTVDNCVFNSTEESVAIYGVRPFCYVAPLRAYDEATSQLLYPAPTIFHEYITVNNCKFYNISHSIMSWNVHNSKYTNNYFYKPTTRTISVTNWNFNILIQGNTHIAVDNTSAILATFINIGTGSEDILIDSEQFIGSVSGVAPNNLLKCVHSNSYSRNITIRNSYFEVYGAEVLVVISRDSEVSIIGNVFEGLNVPIDIIGGTLTSTYNQKHIIIDSNRFKTGSRTVDILGVNAGGTGVVRFTNNQIDNLQVNGIIGLASGTAGWILDMFNNKFPKGAYNYIRNFGGIYTFEREDSLDDKLMHTIPSGADTSITLDYRNYHGRTFYIQPNATVSLTLSDITNARDGVHITIISGGAGGGGKVILPQGQFRNKGNTDLALVANQTASYVRRASFWWEI